MYLVCKTQPFHNNGIKLERQEITHGAIIPAQRQPELITVAHRIIGLLCCAAIAGVVVLGKELELELQDTPTQ